MGTHYLSESAAANGGGRVEQVRIASLALDPRNNQPVVLLKPMEEEAGEGRLLPIWIGHPEATAILLALEGVETPRPMTHDLMLSLATTLEAIVERVEITRVDEGTFYAGIVLRSEDVTRIVDARPSDSIALAIRAGAPIFVSDEVLDAAGIADETTGEVDEEAELAAFRIPKTSAPSASARTSPRAPRLRLSPSPAHS